MNNKYIITVSYGNYTTGVGGTDKVILTQQQICNKYGFDMIHLASTYAHKKDGWWDLFINGEYKDIYTNKRLKRFLYKHQKNGNNLCCIIIHHLNNINIECLNEILEYCDVPIFYYLHDYYSICPKSGLIKENGYFCGTGFPSDNKCKDCSYYQESKSMLKSRIRIINRFENRILFIAPSNAAKDVWISAFPQYQDKVRVIYHQNLVGEYHENNEKISDDEPIRIGFIGYQKPLKGWSQFKEAVIDANKLALNEKFYQFGRGKDLLPFVSQVDVDFKSSMTAMIDALRDNKIHVGVIWSTWPETYAYTYYEAMVSNCFIVTNNLSGNVCKQVRERNNGIVIDDLSELLCNEKYLRKLVNQYRSNGHLTFAELIESEEFITLITEQEWRCERVFWVFDKAYIYSLLKKAKKTVKQVISWRNADEV